MDERVAKEAHEQVDQLEAGAVDVAEEVEEPTRPMRLSEMFDDE